MKKANIIVAVVASALVAGAGLALAGPGARNHGVHRGAGQEMSGGMGIGPLGMLGRAMRRLDLTEEQRTKIEAILEANRDAFSALREQLREGREAFRAAHPPTEFDEPALRAHLAEQAKVQADLAVLGAKVRAQVLALLSPEQLAKLQQMREGFGSRRGHGAGGPAL